MSMLSKQHNTFTVQQANAELEVVAVERCLEILHSPAFGHAGAVDVLLGQVTLGHNPQQLPIDLLGLGRVVSQCWLCAKSICKGLSKSEDAACNHSKLQVQCSHTTTQLSLLGSNQTLSVLRGTRRRTKLFLELDEMGCVAVALGHKGITELHKLAHGSLARLDKTSHGNGFLVDEQEWKHDSF